MIAVIADDFTGAAEIGGIGLRYGLKVVIETKVEKEEDADLLIIAADTRSLSAEKAANEIETLTKQLIALNPRYIYKKLDSVLRGNIADELIAQMKISEKKRSVIIAGNPSFNRLIENGIYYVDKTPLAETFFAQDKEYKIKSSSVVKLIGGDKKDVISIKVGQELPETGLIIGDILSKDDLRNWSNNIDKDTIAAGGSGFFDVLLERDCLQLPHIHTSICKLGKRSLFVFGSAFPKSDQLIKSLQDSNVFISNMPEQIYHECDFSASLIQDWTDEIVGKLNSNNRVVITIDHSGSNEKDISFRIKETVGQLVHNVMANVQVDDLLIEGGATASVVFRCLNITRLYPFQEVGAGVIQMKVAGYERLYVTTKPGSYSWPAEMIFSS